MLTSAPIGPAPHWQQDLLASPRAQKALSGQQAGRAGGPPPAAGPRNGPPGPATSGSAVGRGTEGGSPWNDGVMPAEWQLGNDARVNAVGLLNGGRYDDAYAAITQFRQGRSDDITDDVTVYCALLTGRYAEAYELLVPMVRRQGDNSPQYWLALSFASAELGHVYPGQADFCRAQVAKGLSNEVLEVRDDKLVGRLVTGTDPKTTAILSCLGLGFAYGDSHFLENALWLEPQNVMAAHALIFRYTLNKRPYDARRIATIMVESLRRDDPRRAEFVRRLAESK